MTQDKRYAKLLEAVEQKLQRRITTPRDFDFLSNEIQRTLHANISVSTLKRLWGYVNTESDYRPRMFTLDSLALLLGYQDYAAFLRHKDETASSDFIKNSHLFTSQLMPGDIITLKWLPDRIVEVKFLGQDMFAVTQSINSKLDVGDTFSCGCFINNYPLYLNRLLHGDMAPTSYVCGKEGGIKYEIRRCNESKSRGGVIQHSDFQKINTTLWTLRISSRKIRTKASMGLTLSRKSAMAEALRNPTSPTQTAKSIF